MKLIIPAAGYGTRVPMQPHESKEVREFGTGQPLIKKYLDLDYPKHIITRKDKSELMVWLGAHYPKHAEVTGQLVEPTKEWPATVLASKAAWDEKNCLVLPDTIFTPFNETFMRLERALDRTDVAVAVHWVEDVSKWGHVNRAGGYISEKPDYKGPGWAWGTIAFRREIGEALFTAQLEKQPFRVKMSVIELDMFKDVTR